MIDKQYVGRKYQGRWVVWDKNTGKVVEWCQAKKAAMNKTRELNKLTYNSSQGCQGTIGYSDPYVIKQLPNGDWLWSDGTIAKKVE